LKNKIREVVAYACNITDPIEDDSVLLGDDSDFDLDSLDALSLVASLEKNFKIAIDTSKEPLKKILRSVNSIAEWLNDKGIKC
jgi:acyl carrier protein